MTEQELDALAGCNVAMDGLLAAVTMAGVAASIGVGLMLTVAYQGVLGATRNHP